MKAGRLPETHTARVSAMLSADGSSNASSRSRSVRTSPARTGRFEPPAATACRYSEHVGAGHGDRRSARAGRERDAQPRTTSAVIALATDPIGRTTAGARVATLPFRLVASAKLPCAGTRYRWRRAAPSTSSVAGAWMLTVARGSGAVSLHGDERGRGDQHSADHRDEHHPHPRVRRARSHQACSRASTRSMRACLPTTTSRRAAASHHAA